MSKTILLRTFRFWFPGGYVDAEAENLEQAKQLGLFTIRSRDGKQFACFHPDSAYEVEELPDDYYYTS
jgi:hypothetical protein